MVQITSDEAVPPASARDGLRRRVVGWVSELLGARNSACPLGPAPSPRIQLRQPNRTLLGRESAGPLLLVAADTPERALVVVPDSATASQALAAIPHPASATLFGRSGSVQSAELPAVNDSGACVVAQLSAAPPPHGWNIGFIGGVVAPLPMDSTEAIAHADSAALVVWVNRLASTVPNDSAGQFAGIPFVVHGMWRFMAPGGPQTVVATLSRQLNQEASPMQERTLLIGERNAGDTTYALVYSERSSGLEETVESRDVLAAALLGTNRNPALVVARDFGDATAYGIIERVATTASGVLAGSGAPPLRCRRVRAEDALWMIARALRRTAETRPVLARDRRRPRAQRA